MDDGGGGTRWGYWRLAAPAVILAALEVDEPIEDAADNQWQSN